MAGKSASAPDFATRHYGLQNYPVTIADSQVTATVRTWYWFGRKAVVRPLTEYVAVGHRIVSRRPSIWWLGRWLPEHYRQAILVHRDSRARNVVLGETRISPIESHVASLQLRAMLEKFGEELALPVIDSDRPRRTKRQLTAASPEQVFETRLPDEFESSVRELVARGRLAVDRNVPPPPRGLAIVRRGDALQLTFRYSALWETLKIAGYLLVFVVLASTARPHRHSAPSMEDLIILIGPVIALIVLIALPIQHFFNGNELVLANDRWIYKPASGSLLLPNAQVLSQLNLDEIEEIYRSKRDIVITTDREIVRLRCRSRAMAKWMEQALLAVAAYGLSVLDKCVSESKKTGAGANDTPAPQKH
jgi:hypothetical protein